MSGENGQDRRPPGQEAAGGEQLALIRETVRRTRAKPRTWRGAALAERLPVARVLVDKGLLHLDQFFDYAVPAAMDEQARPGVRVRVRFGARVVGGRREGGTLHDGFVVERRADSDYRGPLAPLAQVLSDEPVLTPPLLALCRRVADRYAGALADVVQLAVPPRMARAEKEPSPVPPSDPPPPDPGSWTRYAAGPAYLQALARGDTPRAVWLALPGPHWPRELAVALATTLAGGRGALAVLPDGRSAARVDTALTELIGPGHHVMLTADAGPEERYRRWLAVSRGTVRAVVGTRAAMFAPVADLGLVALWDDGDSNHSEPHAPQPHARDVTLLRAREERTAYLLGGITGTVEGAQLVESGWALPLAASRDEVRAAAPLIRTIGDADQARDEAARAARLPSLAWQVTRDALARGPVLVQVPRRGYVPRLACDHCRAAARCAACAGPLELRDRQGTPHCGWCGRPAADWHCPECGGFRLRAQVVGARRTAEELGRAFPRVPVRTSGRDTVLATVGTAPALVIATPGAEPVADEGYAAALLLDGWALLNRPDLRAGEEALRRWALAAALVRPAADGGTVVVVAEASLRPVQALVRWDPAGHAVRELAERTELRFPPVARMASVTGSPAALAEFVDQVRLPAGTDQLGPVPLAVPPAGTRGRAGALSPPPGEQWERLLLRVPPGAGAALAAALKEAQVQRAARGAAEPTFVRMDPPDIG
ncbi:primosomal protein N' [Actinacidiphila sp. ITFR-21]|uniref:primosomal protein N' n=1 Tax=Actinacidiphila sp. ITFR-21 TaxID=3075199 RepID=UPI002889868D|nr:primosomal protein N' [Streptomyces sp. ITFR-21]WNI14629.1 primosomal protein N' [Streptomyces sp. ITFR-21]